VIVPCRDEQNWVGYCLDSVLASEYPASRMEVVVADGMSRDGTRAIVESYAARDQRVRLIDNPERITPVALNRAVEAARGDIILRLDAHAQIAPEYVRRGVADLDSTGADNVGGAMRTVARDSGPFAEAIRIVLTHQFGVGNSRFRTGSERPRWVDTVFGGCWRRQVFHKIGKFNERLVRSQDM
jgi:succinoglycan biosynthesis protein ExoA